MKPITRYYTPHLTRTQAESFDEALSILKKQLRRQQWSDKHKGKPAKLIQKMALAKGQAMQKAVTLSDRQVYKGMPRRAKLTKPRVIWSKQQVLDAHATRQFNMTDLATRANVSVHKIRFWLLPDYVPELWQCYCSKATIYKKQTCPRCGMHWKLRFAVEEDDT